MTEFEGSFDPPRAGDRNSSGDDVPCPPFCLLATLQTQHSEHICNGRERHGTHRTIRCATTGSITPLAGRPGQQPLHPESCLQLATATPTSLGRLALLSLFWLGRAHKLLPTLITTRKHHRQVRPSANSMDRRAHGKVQPHLAARSRCPRPSN